MDHSLQQRLLIHPTLAQRMKLLTFSQCELAQYLREEAERNPLLELEEPSWLSTIHQLPPLHKTSSPLPSLEAQCREAFASSHEIAVAQRMVHALDERGFFPHSLLDLATAWKEPPWLLRNILKTLQNFEPAGIAASNLKESLLLQLTASKEKGSIAFRLVECCFEPLLKGQYRTIQKTLALSHEELANAVHRLSRLRFRPMEVYQESQEPSPLAIPDLFFKQQEEVWSVEISERLLPRITLQPQYLHLTSFRSIEEKTTFKGWILSAQWLQRALLQRRQLLAQLGHFLILKQHQYLEGTAPLLPLSIQEAAQALSVHPSTISRAIHSKYALSPQGVIPLSALFAKGLQTIESALREIVLKEDHSNPLTDEAMSQELRRQGFTCARRTLAKYRRALRLGSAAQRKALFSPFRNHHIPLGEPF